MTRPPGDFFHKIGHISANNGPIWKIRNLAYSWDRPRPVWPLNIGARDVAREMTSRAHDPRKWRRMHEIMYLSCYATSAWQHPNAIYCLMMSHLSLITLHTKKGLKLPKIVRFSWSKRLGPHKKGCSTDWNGYLDDMMVRNAFFPPQTCETDGCHGNQCHKVLSLTIPDLHAEFGRDRSTNPGVDSKRTNGQTEGQIQIIVW